jgi:hypothetical protein
MIGLYAGVETQGDFKQLKFLQTKYDGSTFERTLSFDDFDRDSGERSPVSFALGQIKVGDAVAMHVKGMVSRKGTVWYKAVGVKVLPPVLSPVPK